MKTRKDQLLCAATLTLFGLMAVPSHAELVTFSFTLPTSGSTPGPLTIVSGGVTMTLSNPVWALAGGGPPGNSGFGRDSFGLNFVDSDSFEWMKDFDFKFDTAVKLVSYDITAPLSSINVADMDLTSSSLSSLDNGTATLGTNVFNGTSLNLPANQPAKWTYTPTAPAGYEGTFQVGSITVDVIPEPASSLLGTLALAAGLMRRRRDA